MAEQGLKDYTISYRCKNCNHYFVKKFKRGMVAPRDRVECPMCGVCDSKRSWDQSQVDSNWISKKKDWPDPMVILPPATPRRIPRYFPPDPWPRQWPERRWWWESRIGGLGIAYRLHY